jgi:hypothetical protein
MRWHGDRTVLIRALAVCVLAAPFAGCEEEVFPYRTEALYRVDSNLVSHVEVAAWPAPVPPPAFLATLPDGNIVVVGGRAGAILGTNGALQTRFQWSGAAATAVAAAPDGRIFIGTGVRVLARNGAGTVSTWDSLGEQARITGLAADSNQVWACDAGQRLVWCFDFDGRLTGQLPTNGAPRAESFVVPSPSFAAATGVGGGFWVVNPGRFQLQCHAPDGRLLRSWAKPGMSVPGFSGCCNPAYLAVLPDGRLVTSEKKIPRVKIYAADGTFQSVAVPPSALSGDEGRPVAVDRAGRVLVLDGNRVRVFAGRTEKRP